MLHPLTFIMAPLWAKIALNLSARPLLSPCCYASTVSARSASTSCSDLETKRQQLQICPFLRFVPDLLSEVPGTNRYSRLDPTHACWSSRQVQLPAAFIAADAITCGRQEVLWSRLSPHKLGACLVSDCRKPLRKCLEVPCQLIHLVVVQACGAPSLALSREATEQLKVVKHTVTFVRIKCH